jgi:hypothetical protein
VVSLWTPAHWLALVLQDESSGGSVTRLINFGALGIILVLFITGYIVTGAQYRRVLEENKTLHDLITAKVVPLLEKTTTVIEENNELAKRYLVPAPPSELRYRDLPLEPGGPLDHQTKEGS